MTTAAYLIEKKAGQTGFDQFKTSHSPTDAFTLASELKATFPGCKVNVYAVPADQLDSLLQAMKSTNGRTHALQESGVLVSSLSDLPSAQQDLDRITNINSRGSFDHLWKSIPTLEFANA